MARQDAPRGYKVHYSLMNRFSLEKEATLSLKEYVDILEKSFQQVKENFDNLEVIEKANSLSIIFGMAIVTRFQLDLLNIAEPNSKGFKEQQWRVFRIANEIFNFAKEKASPDNSEMQLVYAILANEVIKMADLLENSLKTKKKPKKRQANS